MPFTWSFILWITPLNFELLVKDLFSLLDIHHQLSFLSHPVMSGSRRLHQVLKNLQKARVWVTDSRWGSVRSSLFSSSTYCYWHSVETLTCIHLAISLEKARSGTQLSDVHFIEETCTSFSSPQSNNHEQVPRVTISALKPWYREL